MEEYLLLKPKISLTTIPKKHPDSDKHFFLFYANDGEGQEVEFPIEMSVVREMIEYLDNKIHH